MSTRRSDNPGPGSAGALDQMLEAVVAGGPDPVAPHAFLLVLSGTDPGRLHVLERPEMVIGRSRYADIHISERALSQQHCKITRYGEGHRVFDLGSTNGTFVNDVRTQQADLKPGDVIRTGETVFTYMAGGQSAGALPRPVHGQIDTLPPPSAPPPSASTALARVPRMDQPPPPFTALARRPVQAAVPYTDVGYAGAPQVLEVPMPTAPDGGADLLERILWVLGFLRRYWLSIFIMTFLGAAAGAASYKFVKPPAKAEFEISLQPDASDNPAERMRRTNFEFFRSALNNFKRPGLIHETLKELGETEVTPERIRGVQAELEFKKIGEYTYAGAYAAPTPDEAIEFLNVHLKLYSAAEIDKALKVLLAEVETLDAQLKQAEETLTSTSQAILAFKQQHSEGLPEKASFLLQRALELGVERSRALGHVTRSTASAQVARKALRSEDPVIEARIQESRPYAQGIADAARRLAEARAEGKGPEHPDVLRIEEEKKTLEALRDQVLQEGTSKVIKAKNPAYRAARGELEVAEADQRVAQAELTRVTKELEEVSGLVDKLPRLQAEFEELTRTEAVVQRQYNDLFQQLNGTRVRLELERSQAQARIDLLTPPNVKPVSRLKTIFMRVAIGVFLGGFFGVGLGVLRELRRYVVARLAAVRR
ncbi:MAG: FHA domain-containing protein [Nannocystaceae bacterium]